MVMKYDTNATHTHATFGERGINARICFVYVTDRNAAGEKASKTLDQSVRAFLLNVEHSD
jgi:hypothetical protein